MQRACTKPIEWMIECDVGPHDIRESHCCTDHLSMFIGSQPCEADGSLPWGEASMWSVRPASAIEIVGTCTHLEEVVPHWWDLTLGELCRPIRLARQCIAARRLQRQEDLEATTLIHDLQEIQQQLLQEPHD